MLRVIHNRMGEELFIASTQNLEDLDRWLVTLVAAGASSLQPGAAKSCARAVGRPLARGGATGGVSGSLSERWRSICFGNQAFSFCKIAPQPQNPGCEMKILLLAAPNCCLPPAAPRRPALTPSHLRRAQKKSRLRTSCEPLGLPRARASGLCRGLAGRVRGGVAGPRLATAAATPSTAGVASLSPTSASGNTLSSLAGSRGRRRRSSVRGAAAVGGGGWNFPWPVPRILLASRTRQTETLPSI